MILDEYNDLKLPSQLLMSKCLRETPGFGHMIHKLVSDTKEQLLNLNPEGEGFNLRYRELQFQVREYEGLIVILERVETV